MGLFHPDAGELHGITVVVETHGPRVYVGICHEESEEGMLLRDADHHDDGEDGKSNAEYLDFAKRYGVFKKHDRVMVRKGEIASVRRLGEI